MGKYEQYDEAMQNASVDAGKKPWELIVDGKHTVQIKSMLADENEKGPWIDVEFYYPKFNASERNRWFINSNPINMGRLKANLLAINPKFQSLDKDLDKTIALAKNGKAEVKRETTTGKNDKQYINYYINAFTPDEVPF